MPRISQVSWPKMELRYGYLFDIQDYDELSEWWENVRKSISTKDFNDALKWQQGRAHANHLAQLADLWGVDLLTALSRMQQHYGEGLDKVLNERKRLFINAIGGYFGYSDEFQISDTRMIDVWALPQETLRIIQWPDGTHFYAKVGNEDVVFDGKQKWDTREAAETAGEKYLKGKRR
jgi:hypothetical protein